VTTIENVSQRFISLYVRNSRPLPDTKVYDNWDGTFNSDQQHQFAVFFSCASDVGTSELDDKASNAPTTKQFPAPLRFIIDAGNPGTANKLPIGYFVCYVGCQGSTYHVSFVSWFIVATYCYSCVFSCIYHYLTNRVFSPAETPSFSSYNSWSCCWKGTVWIITVDTRQQGQNMC